MDDKRKRTSCSQPIMETVGDWEHGKGRLCSLEFGL